MLTAEAVIAALQGSAGFVFAGDNRLSFRGVVVDSRQAGEGALFAALPGEVSDGHDHIADALRRGATGILARADRWGEPPAARPPALFLVGDTLAALQRIAGAWRRRHSVRVVGVTGSIGKTTTREVVGAVLSERYQVLKSERNLNNEIGLPLTLLKLDGSHEWAVVEMGMYALGEIDLLCRLALPEIGVVTNVGPSHLERLGSIERIAMAKEELVRSLPRQGLAVLNGDDPRVRAMASRSPAPCLLFGTSEACDVWASDIVDRGLAGMSLRLQTRGWEAETGLSLLGMPGVYAALAAAAVALGAGLTRDEVLAGLGKATLSLRLAVFPGLRDSVIIDDSYNASPASMRAALEVLGGLATRRIAVLGDILELGGDEAEGHQQVGEFAAGVADVLVVVGPRGRLIGEEAQRRGLASVLFARDNEEAAERVLSILRAGDHVLVKGSRGMKMEQIVERIRAN